MGSLWGPYGVSMGSPSGAVPMVSPYRAPFHPILTGCPYRILIAVSPFCFWGFCQVYLADTFGLKTLDGRGALGGCVVPGVGHTGWHNHRGVYERCIRPWLT